MTDMVNHPPHYNQGKYEVKEVIKDLVSKLPGDQAYVAGNIIKYISRYHFKNGVEDLGKARWYIDKLIDLLVDEEIDSNEYRAEVSK